MLLAGGTGLIGRELTQLLLADKPRPEPAPAGAQACPRTPTTRASWQPVDFAALPALPAADEAYCCLGTTIKQAGSQAAFRAVDFDAVLAFARAARAAGVTRFAVVSALGASARSAGFYNRVKGEMEAAVGALGFASVVIARPSLLAGDRAALGQPERSGERLALMAHRPVRRADPEERAPDPGATVARGMMAALRQARPGVRIVESGELQELGAERACRSASTAPPTASPARATWCRWATSASCSIAGCSRATRCMRERNWAPPSPDLLQADAVVLSHAHLDHSGWLPALVKHGFRGPIYASPATRDLAEVLLLDSAHLQEEDARRANRYGYSRHAKALPLYTRRDAQRAIAKIVPLLPGREKRCGDVGIGLTPVGHLLGACAVTLTHGDERLVFSGDVGRSHDLLMPAPQTVAEADVLLVESTYGNRVHPSDDASARLAQIIRETVQRGGSVLMPAFAVGRAQALMLVLQRLKAAGEIPPDLPVYLDSPMAVQATALYHKHRRLLRIGAREADHLSDGVHMVGDAQQSMRLVRSRWPSVIISASGMATGGRVLHHLKAMAPMAKHHIVFAGFQVGGSRGAQLVAGATRGEDPRRVRAGARAGQPAGGLLGPCRCQRADGLAARLPSVRRARPSSCTASPMPADALRLRIKDQLGWSVRVPQHGEQAEA